MSVFIAYWHFIFYFIIMKTWKTVLQNLNIYNTIHNFDKWGCGCDYLRLNYKNESEFIEYYINLLDCDNSNFATREVGGCVFTIQKDYNSLGIALTFSCSYNDVSIPCCQFVKFNEHNSYLFKSYWKFDFYWSMFRLVDMGFFEKSIFLLLKVLISEENPKITRFDYRIDFFSMKEKKIPSPEKFLKYIHTQSKIRKWEKWGEFESWDIWKSSKNNRYSIRFYNKLLDSDKKEKIFLYQDYFIYNSVLRLEFEFQPNFLKWYTFYDFYDWLIQDKIESILWLSEKLFRGSMFYQYQADYTIQDKDKVKYLKKYSSSSVRLAKNWINPLIQCYKACFYELEEDELLKNVQEFMDFIWQDKHLYKMRYNALKKEFLSLHTI